MQVGLQLFVQAIFVAEREVFGVLFDKEIKRVDHRHVGDDFDLYRQAAGFLRKHQTCLKVAVRVLLPVNKVRFGLDFQAVRANRRAAMRRRTQTYDVRRQRDRAVEVITGLVIQGDCNGHWATACWASCSFRNQVLLMVKCRYCRAICRSLRTSRNSGPGSVSSARAMTVL